MRLFEHDLAICTDDEKKNNINACVAYLKKNGVKGLPRGDHVIFAHKGTVELISWAKFENYFTNPTTKTDYIRDKDKHYLVVSCLHLLVNANGGLVPIISQPEQRVNQSTGESC